MLRHLWNQFPPEMAISEISASTEIQWALIKFHSWYSQQCIITLIKITEVIFLFHWTIHGPKCEHLMTKYCRNSPIQGWRQKSQKLDILKFPTIIQNYLCDLMHLNVIHSLHQNLLNSLYISNQDHLLLGRQGEFNYSMSKCVHLF